jgi:hypothetical protein
MSYKTNPKSYGYVPKFEINWDMYEEGYIKNKAVEYLISEFSSLTKNILTYEEACNYWIFNCGVQGIKCTKDDVHEAYTACYGGGCEWEWYE